MDLKLVLQELSTASDRVEPTAKTTMAARMPRTMMTIRSSMRVKPSSLRLAWRRSIIVVFLPVLLSGRLQTSSAIERTGASTKLTIMGRGSPQTRKRPPICDDGRPFPETLEGGGRLHGVTRSLRAPAVDGHGVVGVVGDL